LGFWDEERDEGDCDTFDVTTVTERLSIESNVSEEHLKEGYLK
jgi:hypothetical protein